MSVAVGIKSSASRATLMRYLYCAFYIALAQ